MPRMIQMVRLSVSPSLKSSAAGGHLLDGDFLGERMQVFPLHSFERGQGAQQFYADFTGIGTCAKC